MVVQRKNIPVMEQFLKDKGWKIYSKQGRKKFWESPIDGKKYMTQFAVSAQLVHDEEQREAHRVKHQEDMRKGLEEEYDKYLSFEVSVDAEFPPPKKEKRLKKKISKAKTNKIIKELGF